MIRFSKTQLVERNHASTNETNPQAKLTMCKQQQNNRRALKGKPSSKLILHFNLHSINN